jgi:hypothetical protein
MVGVAVIVGESVNDEVGLKLGDGVGVKVWLLVGDGDGVGEQPDWGLLTITAWAVLIRASLTPYVPGTPTSPDIWVKLPAAPNAEVLEENGSTT